MTPREKALRALYDDEELYTEQELLERLGKETGTYLASLTLAYLTKEEIQEIRERYKDNQNRFEACWAIVRARQKRRN